MGLCERDTLLKASDHGQPMGAWGLRDPAAKERILSEWDPDVLLGEEGNTETRRHNSDDGERTLIQSDRTSDYLRVRAESAEP